MNFKLRELESHRVSGIYVVSPKLNIAANAQIVLELFEKGVKLSPRLERFLDLIKTSNRTQLDRPSVLAVASKCLEELTGSKWPKKDGS